jgi:hypothetical protein
MQRLLLYCYCLLLVMPYIISMEADIPDTQALLAEQSSLDEVCIQMDDIVKHTGQKAFIETMKRALLPEIWLYIISFLEADDRALKFILQLIEINQEQALELVKNYKVKTGEDPVRFFDTVILRKNVEQIKIAWRLLKNTRSQLKRYIATNQIEHVKDYFDAECKRVMLLQDDTLVPNNFDRNGTIKQLEYLLYYIDYFQDFIHQCNTENDHFNNSIFSSHWDKVCCIVITSTIFIPIFLFVFNLVPVILYLEDFDKCTKITVDPSSYTPYNECIAATWDFLMSSYSAIIGSPSFKQLYRELLNECKVKHETGIAEHQATIISQCFNTRRLPVTQLVLTDTLWLIVPIAIGLWKYFCKPRLIIPQDIVTLFNSYKLTLQAYKATLNQRVSQ